MKILYVAKFGQHDNADEDSIAYAFEQLGHTVIKVEEKSIPYNLRDIINTQADFLLFHHCDRYLESILGFNYIPRVFWTFDLFSSEDPQLAARMQNRQRWLRKCLPHISLGFMTDGDQVAADTTGKLVHLMQGADERFVGYGEPKYTLPPILFTGTSKHGLQRESHIKELKERYGDKFWVLGEDGPRGRKHGRELADIFASVKIVIAPDGPSTDLYWSNRVFLVTGLGGFLIHPYCQKMVDEFYNPSELCYYESRKGLNDLIDWYLENPVAIERKREMGYQTTIAKHLYRHRCEQMIQTIKERIL